jgi:hypothetical protein
MPTVRVYRVKTTYRLYRIRTWKGFNGYINITAHGIGK